MNKNYLKKELQDGKIVFGPFLKFTDPAAVEIMGFAGFDFVIIDEEHGPISIQSAQNMIRAAESVNITPVIRVSNNNESLILRALDIGAQGIEIPQINSKSDAMRAVKSVKYSPQGERGVCRYVRAANYSSMDKFKYFRFANQETMIIAHIEGVKGINNLDEILSVPGIDVIFIGPYDLSQSLGIPGEVNHPLVTKKMKEVVLKCKENKVSVGTFADDVKTAKFWVSLGVQYMSFSVDVGILYEASKQIVKKLKNNRE
ncbi:MAG: aldolase/citrate lyase family protein [Candidatus Caldatribacteriota bacterium]|nr:aldolase/citrate lyase family protein [Candidatus Caldatribacteriota bacterium]